MKVTITPDMLSRWAEQGEDETAWAGRLSPSDRIVSRVPATKQARGSTAGYAVGIGRNAPLYGSHSNQNKGTRKDMSVKGRRK